MKTVNTAEKYIKLNVLSLDGSLDGTRPGGIPYMYMDPFWYGLWGLVDFWSHFLTLVLIRFKFIVTFFMWFSIPYFHKI